MTDGTAYLKEIKKNLEKGQRQWKRGDKLLEAFGYVRSRAFPRPETGKIAVKVINRYGAEVLKVCEA